MPTKGFSHNQHQHASLQPACSLTSAPAALEIPVATRALIIQQMMSTKGQLLIYISMLRIILLLSAQALVRYPTMHKHMMCSDIITCFTEILHSCMVPGILLTRIKHISLGLTRNCCHCQSSCITVASKFLVHAICSDCPASAACTTLCYKLSLSFQCYATSSCWSAASSPAFCHSSAFCRSSMLRSLHCRSAGGHVHYPQPFQRSTRQGAQ